MRIGELAERSNVSVRSLRYYEQQGLLVSRRSSSGQRRYREEEVERVAYIQALYAAGLSSRTIGMVLPCVESPSEDNSNAALELMGQERGKLSVHIERLIETQKSLDRLMEAALEHRNGLMADAEVNCAATEGRVANAR